MRKNTTPIGKKALVFQVCYANYNSIKNMSYVDSKIFT